MDNAEYDPEPRPELEPELGNVPEAPPCHTRRAMILSMRICVGLLAVFVFACSSGGGDTAGWERSAAGTTCKDWLSQMTPAQKDAMAKAALKRCYDRGLKKSGNDLDEFVPGMEGLCTQMRSAGAGDDSIEKVADGICDVTMSWQK